MSDSEDDLFQNNFCTFQNESSTISVKGPHINRTFLNPNFGRSNMLTSTMLMPKNIERSGLSESYHHSIYNRRDRDVSPSLRSIPVQRQNLMMNARGGSAMSVRSFETTTSVSAGDIAMAIREGQFNNHDLKIIKDAYNSFMKPRMRRKIEKRRKKRFRSDRRNSEDSGDQGSDSSASDDCRSLQRSSIRDNISCCRSTKTDISYLRNTIKNNNIYRDCTSFLKQNTFRNTLSIGTQSVYGDCSRNIYSGFREPQFKAPRSVCSDIIPKKTSAPVLRDRFKTSFLLPSQRFNKSVASMTIQENIKESCSKQSNHHKSTIQQSKPTDSSLLRSQPVTSCQTDTDDDDMFLQISDRNKVPSTSSKRDRDNDENIPINYKRSRIADEDKSRDNPKNDFNFVKPSLPVKVSLSCKSNETICSRSKMIQLKSPHANSAESGVVWPEPREVPSNITQNESTYDKHVESSRNCSNDVSMRPSFIKRKLFSQKLDVTEAKNSTDSSSESPQVDSYKGLLRERNKARKLAINNSCLSRDISSTNNNILDLIHKIVPADQMNMTNVANQTNKNETKDTTDPGEKWDITTAITTCNKDNVSDTFTDDELFNFNIGTKKKNSKSKESKNSKGKKDDKHENNTEKENIKPGQNKNDNCKKIVLSPCEVVMKPMPESVQKKIIVEKKISFSCVDNFFDTDYDTDTEIRKKTQNRTKPTPTDNSTVKDFANNSPDTIRNPLKGSASTTLRVPPLASKRLLKAPFTKLKEIKDISSIKGTATLDKGSDTKDDVIKIKKPKETNPSSVFTHKSKNTEQVPESKSIAKNVSAKKQGSNKPKVLDQKNENVELSKLKTGKQNPNESFSNNSRSRRTRRPTSRIETPVSSVRTRSASKTSKNTTTQKHVLQDSFEALSNNAKKCKKTKDKIDLDTQNTSMTLRSRSFQSDTPNTSMTLRSRLFPETESIKTKNGVKSKKNVETKQLKKTDVKNTKNAKHQSRFKIICK